MSICGLPLLECVYCLDCARWVWKRCLYTAGHASENWGLAIAEEFEPVPRLCHLILAIYKDDLRKPIWAPPGGYDINPDWIILRKTHEETEGRATPYLIYLDHNNADIVLAVRGLNLARESDYAVLLDKKLGQTKFCGGYVHNGLLKAAKRVFDRECDVLSNLVAKNPEYGLTFAGYSLGAGMVSLMVIYAIQNLNRLGNIERERIRCFSMAPARCMLLNLAVRYADVINYVVLQLLFGYEVGVMMVEGGARIKLKRWQQAAVAIGSAVGALLDPRRADLIVALGETTGKPAFERVLQSMKKSPEGRKVLLERPPVISAQVAHAWDLLANTFGAAYARFMGSRNFSPDDRPPVRFMETDELAYVAMRAHEVHDFWHTLLDLPTNLIGESALKVIEFEQMCLPMCLMSVVGGSAKFSDKQRRLFFQHYFPWAMRAGVQCTDLMCLYYEKHFHEDLEELRRKLGIIPAPLPTP